MIRPIKTKRPPKHPTVATNSRAEILVACTEGTGWQRGGSGARQFLDTAGVKRSDGQADGVRVWGSLAAFYEPDDTFTILH